MSNRRFEILCWIALLGTIGCTSEEKNGLLVEPPLADGKADVGDHVVDSGPLGFGEDNAVTGDISQDLEYHGYRLVARAGAVVTLDVTQRGSSRTLDSAIFLYGPRREAGGFGTSAIAFDDDAGWGLLSRIRSFTLETEGEYLVVLGTANARGRGRYRLEARCESGDCSIPPPPPVGGLCPTAFADRIETCVTDWMESEPEWFYTTTRRNLIEQCADIEIIAPTFDALCAEPNAPAELCANTLEQLSLGILPGCAHEVLNRTLDAMCVFGDRYRDVFSSGALIVLEREVLTSASTLGSLETSQVIAAVGVSAADPTSLAEAFDAVDGGEVNRTELWDASNRLAFVAYEYGAGDNSYGAIFAWDSTDIATSIQDGDLYGCTTTWGAERRECRSDEQCAEGLRCLGIASEITRGRCVDTDVPAHPAQDSECSADAPCPVGSGLQCAGAPTSGAGICRPAWLTSAFDTNAEQSIPDGSTTGTDVTLVAYGLATVDVDVKLDLWIDHPRVADLRISLINPSGTEIVIADRDRTGPEVSLDDFVVRGFSGDESVNGVWRLRVVDGVRGSAGQIRRFGLTITSRWD